MALMSPPNIHMWLDVHGSSAHSALKKMHLRHLEAPILAEANCEEPRPTLYDREYVNDAAVRKDVPYANLPRPHPKVQS